WTCFAVLAVCGLDTEIHLFARQLTQTPAVRASRECQGADATLDGARVRGVWVGSIMMHRHAWLASALLLIACTDGPKQYTLVAQAGPALSDTPRIVKLRKIAVASYLDRSQIVRSSQDVQFDVVDDATWGEPFDTMLARVLVQALSERLPDSTVFVE